MLGGWTYAAIYRSSAERIAAFEGGCGASSRRN
jgi:hypothetical protein